VIRRWSCLNVASSSVFFNRFGVKKLVKALNFRNFNTGLTRFKRKKLSKWRRLSNFSILVQILKNWIKEYYFTKKITRLDFCDLILPYSFNIQDGISIKRKTPLLVRQSYPFVTNSSYSSICKYFFKKFDNTELSFHHFNKNQMKSSNMISTNEYELQNDNLDVFYILFLLSPKLIFLNLTVLYLLTTV